MIGFLLSSTLLRQTQSNNIKWIGHKIQRYIRSFKDSSCSANSMQFSPIHTVFFSYKQMENNIQVATTLFFFIYLAVYISCLSFVLSKVQSLLHCSSFKKREVCIETAQLKGALVLGGFGRTEAMKIINTKYQSCVINSKHTEEIMTYSPDLPVLLRVQPKRIRQPNQCQQTLRHTSSLGVCCGKVLPALFSRDYYLGKRTRRMSKPGNDSRTLFKGPF